MPVRAEGDGGEAMSFDDNLYSFEHADNQRFRARREGRAGDPTASAATMTRRSQERVAPMDHLNPV